MFKDKKNALCNEFNESFRSLFAKLNISYDKQSLHRIYKILQLVKEKWLIPNCRLNYQHVLFKTYID